MAEATTELAPDEQVYEYQDDRDAKCPFAPPPGLRALNDKAPVTRGKIWDGSTPWLVTGHAAQRAILSDPRVSSDDKQPGFPYPNQRRAHRQDAGRPQAGRPGDLTRAAAALADDLRAARCAVRGPRLLLAARVKDGDLTLPEATLLAIILLIAGHETSATMITVGTALLLENPEQLARLQQIDNTKDAAGAVEEILRYLTVAQFGQRRIASEDFEFEGVDIKAGDGIVVPLPAGNWDPDAFPDPEKLDLTRKATHHHAFGWGIHQCLGQQLARIELQVVYGTLYRRVPTLRLAVDRDELEFRPADALAFGIRELPVTW